MIKKSSAEEQDLIEAYNENELILLKDYGYSPRAFTTATLPHRRPTSDKYIRKNGNFTLTMTTAHPDGLPYGVAPRLILSWICTEITRTKSRTIHLGDSLSEYLYSLGLNRTGGARGDLTRVKDAMSKLCMATITCHYEDKNIIKTKKLSVSDEFASYWQPATDKKTAGTWQSELFIQEGLYNECIEHRIPFKWSAFTALKKSSLSIDIYVWLVYRIWCLKAQGTSINIPWGILMGQFGVGYPKTPEGIRSFKKNFLKELKKVQVVYPEAKVDFNSKVFIVKDSPLHIPEKIVKQPSLF